MACTLVGRERGESSVVRSTGRSQFGSSEEAQLSQQLMVKSKARLRGQPFRRFRISRVAHRKQISLYRKSQASTPRAGPGVPDCSGAVPFHYPDFCGNTFTDTDGKPVGERSARRR